MLPPTPSMLPPKPPSRLARFARRALGALAALLVLVGSLALSLAYHLTLPEARGLAKDLVEELASDALRGDLEIGSVDELSLARARFSDVVLYDEGHRAVIAIPELTVWPDLGRLFEDGTIRVAGARAVRPSIWLYTVDAEGRLDPDGLEVSLVQAFLPSSPGEPGGEPIHIAIDGLRLEGAHVQGDVPRYPGIVGDDLDVYGRIDIEREVQIQVFSAHGRLTGPYDGDTFLDDVVLRFSTDWDTGLDAYVAAHREGSRVTSRVRLTQPGDEAMRLAVRAQLDPLELPTIGLMGFMPEGALMGRVRGFVTLAGPLDELRLRGDLETDAGPLDLEGTIEPEGRYRFSARVDGFDLDAIVPNVPPMLLAGDASIELDTTSGTLAPARVTLELAPFRVQGFVLPALRAEGRLGDDAVLVDRVLAPDLSAGADGTVSGGGRVGYDGSIQLELALDVADLGRDPNVARLVPGAHGAVHGSVRVTSGPLAEGLVSDVDVSVRGLRYGGVTARQLAARGQVTSEAAGARVRLDASGEGLVAGGVLLGHFGASVRGGPSRYLFTLDLRGGDPIRAAHVEAAATIAPSGAIDLAASELSVDTDLGRFGQVIPTRLHVAGSNVRFDALSLARRGGEEPSTRIDATGLIGARAASGFAVDVHDFPLDLLSSLVGESLSRMAGNFGGTLQLDGPLRAPRLSIHGAIDQLSFDRVRAANVEYRITHEDGILRLSVLATPGGAGSIVIEGPIAIPFDALLDPARWSEDASFSGVRFAVDQVGLPFVAPLLALDERAEGLSGKFSMSGELRGTMEHPYVDRFVLILDRFSVAGVAPLRAKIDLALADRDLTVRHLWIADTEGEIALAEGRFVLPDAVPSGGYEALAAVASNPWSLGVRLEPRLLSSWPEPFSQGMPQGLSLGGALSATGGPEGAEARVDASLHWDPSGFDDGCTRREAPTIQLTFATEPEAARAGRRGAPTASSAVAGPHRRTRGTATVFADGRSIGAIELRADTPIDEWLAGTSIPSVPEVLASFTLDEVPLGRLPGSCAYAAGRVSGSGAITLFSDEPAFQADLSLRQLRLRSRGAEASRPYDVAVRAVTTGAGWTALAACAVVGENGESATPVGQCALAPLAAVTEGTSEAMASIAASAPVPLEGEAIIRAAIPVRFHRDSPVPELGVDRALFAEGQFSMAHLEPLLVLAPGLARADAIGDGTVRLVSVGEDVQLGGGLQLSEGRARILALGQQLENISGFVGLRGDRVVIAPEVPLRASDPAGSAAVDGEIRFSGIFPSTMDLHLASDGFPFRREGAVLANLFGEVFIRLAFGEDGLDGSLRTHEFDVRLPDHLVGSLMELEARREIQVIGEDAFELTRTSEARYPYRLHLDASEPFTVQRNDFSALLTAQLDLVYADPELSVTGTATLASGTFEIFGKRFAITRGSLLFLEEAALDPVIDLVATYALPGRSGASISIEVGGRLTDMTITFTSTETSDVGEILALLVSGASSRSAEQTAQEAGGQAANFVAGLTAGLLTLTLRRELGDVGNVVPAVSIETAGAAGTLRARAYWDASMIIPDFLRDVVVGASVEGFITSDQNDGGAAGGSSGAGGGLTIEFQFPYGLRSTGTFVPPQSWSADVLWQP